MKSRKTKLLIIALVIATMLCTVFAVMASANETENTPEIISKNIQYGEKYSIMYAVDANSVAEGDVTLKVYTQYPNIEDGKTFTYVSKAPETIKIGDEDVSAYVFITGGIPAQNFADKFYAQAFDSEDNASEVVTYSVVEYMLERLYGGYNLTEVQEELYTTALAFGAASQKRFNPDDQYKVNDYKYVRVVGGTANGVSKGMFIKNTALALEADVPTGYAFSGWKVNGEENLVTDNEFTLEDNAIIEAVFEEIDLRLNFNDGNLPADMTKDFSSSGASVSVVDAPLSEAPNKALVYDTNAGALDLLYFKPILAENNATKVVFETKYYVDLENATNSGQAFEYVNGSTKVGSITITFVGDGNIKVSDYSDGSNSFSTKTFKIDDTAKWIDLKFVSYIDANNSFCTEIWINGSLKATSTNSLFANTTVDKITGIRVRAYKNDDAKIYFDDMKFVKVADKVDGYYTFNDGEIAPGISTEFASVDATLSVTKDPFNSSDNKALVFDTNAGGVDFLYFKPTSVSADANKVIFETKYYATDKSDKTFEFVNASDNKLGCIRITMQDGGNVKISDYDSTNSFPSKTVNVGEAQWISVKLVGYKNADNVFCTEIWINETLVATSTNASYVNTEIGNITKMRYRAYKADDANIYFDDVKFVKVAE